MSARRTILVQVCSTLLVAGVLATVPAAAASGPETRSARPHAHVRVDQLGYLPGEGKHARLMLGTASGRPRFVVVNAAGEVVLHGRAAASPGHWNATYHAVYDLSFSRLREPGRYRIVVRSAHTASPWFLISRAKTVYGTLLRYGIRFDQVQRDGAHVIRGALDHVRPT